MSDEFIASMRQWAWRMIVTERGLYSLDDISREAERVVDYVLSGHIPPKDDAK